MVDTVARAQRLDLEGLQPYTQVAKTNIHGLLYLAGHLSTLVLTGYAVFATLGTWWVIPTMIVHGFVMAFLFAPVHECAHSTPFRNRRLNEAVFKLLCFIYLVPPTAFRFGHLAHHRHTQVRGHDPDMVLPERATIFDYLWYVTAIPFFRRSFMWLVVHATGRMSSHSTTETASSDSQFIPKGHFAAAYRDARVFLALYASVALVSVASGSWLALWLWILPRFVGEPFMRWIRIAEHAECDEGPDLTRNTRTTRAPAWLRTLFWNMNFHAEHHLFPNVPFHALPRLHAAVATRLHPIGESYFAVHATVLDKLFHRTGVTWNQGVASD